MDPRCGDVGTRRAAGQGPGGRAGGRARSARIGRPGLPGRMPADRLADAGAPPGLTMHRMIHDVDELLETLVRRDALNGSAVDLAFEAPTKDWVARTERARRSTCTCTTSARTSSAACRPGRTSRDTKGASPSAGSRRAGSGSSYLVTAWTQRPEDEHRLLSSLLACFLRNTIDQAPRTCDWRRSTRRTCRSTWRSGQPREPGPVARRRLVGAGRRAEAVARPRRHRPDRRRRASAYVGPPVPRGRRSGCRPRPAPASARPAARRAAAPIELDETPPSSCRRTRARRTAGVRIRVSGVRASLAGDGGGDPAIDRHRAGRRGRRARPSGPVASRTCSGGWPSSSAGCGPPWSAGGPSIPTRGSLPRPVHLRRAGRRPARPASRRRCCPSPADATATRGAGRARGRVPSARAAAGTDAPAAPPRGAFGLEPARRRAAAGRARPRPRAPLRAALRLPPRRRVAAPGEHRPGPRAVRRRPPAPGARRLATGSDRCRRSSTRGLLIVEEPERPFLTRSLRVPDRVAAHLLGDRRARPAWSRRS